MSAVFGKFDQLASQWSTIGVAKDAEIARCLEAGKELIADVESCDRSTTPVIAHKVLKAMQSQSSIPLDKQIESIAHDPKKQNAFLIFARLLDALKAKKIAGLTSDDDFRKSMETLQHIRTLVNIEKERHKTPVSEEDVLKYPKNYWLTLGRLSPAWKQVLLTVLHATEVSTLDLGIRNFSQLEAFVNDFGADLTYLNLHSCDFLEGDQWALLQRLRNLQELIVQGCLHFNDHVLKHISALSRLSRLTVWQSQMTDTGLTYVKQMANLEALQLVNCQVTPQGFALMGPWENLLYLELCRLPNWKYNDVSCLQCCPQLVKIDFIHPLRGIKPLITNPKDAIVNLKQLREMTIGYARIREGDMRALKQQLNITFNNIKVH